MEVREHPRILLRGEVGQQRFTTEIHARPAGCDGLIIRPLRLDFH